MAEVALILWTYQFPRHLQKANGACAAGCWAAGGAAAVLALVTLGVIAAAAGGADGGEGFPFFMDTVKRGEMFAGR